VTSPTSRLAVKVIPGSSSNVIAGWLGDTLRVRVTAAPEKGKANAAVRRIVAETLGLPASAVVIIKGETAQRKVIEVAGLDRGEVRRRLSAA
jgi:uncharacterized protein (TIGR00251 family)